MSNKYKLHAFFQFLRSRTSSTSYKPPKESAKPATPTGSSSPVSSTTWAKSCSSGAPPKTDRTATPPTESSGPSAATPSSWDAKSPTRPWSFPSLINATPTWAMRGTIPSLGCMSQTAGLITSCGRGDTMNTCTGCWWPMGRLCPGRGWIWFGSIQRILGMTRGPTAIWWRRKITRGRSG